MKSYLKLVNFEVSRVFKFYIILIGLLAICQIAGIIIDSLVYMNRAENYMLTEQLTVDQYVREYSAYYFQNFIQSGWFVLSIVFCIAVLMLYVFFIWYRDWFGKSKFMYRLLMLPTERRNIYFAKLTTIMLLVLGLVTIQIFLILLEHNLSNMLVASEFRKDIWFFEIYRIEILTVLYPQAFMDFIVFYILGLIFVAVVFTAILLERSYHLKGIFYATVYGVLVSAVFIAPLLLDQLTGNYFYAIEILGMEIVVSLLIVASAIWLSNYLLQYKIKV